MKNERLLNNMNLLDDKYIDEANPEKKKRKRKVNFIKLGALVACLCLMITAINLYLFIPFSSNAPDISDYSDSEYYPIIEKFNALSAIKPKFKNNFDKILSSFVAFGKNFAPKDDVDVNFSPDMPSEDANGNAGNENYQEITDNQVQGVIEGDIIKRSDKYIYYLSHGVLRVYSIEGYGSKLISEFNLCPIIYYNSYDKMEDISLSSSKEMYLSEDCKTVSIIGMCDGKTTIVSLDVSDVTNITMKNYAMVEGYYYTSRLVEGKLLVITQKSYNQVDFSREETFVPQISYDKGAKNQLIPMDKISCPDKIISKNYTVVSLLDESTLDFSGCAGFLSFSNDVYITNNAIYATNTLREDISDTVSTKSKTVTEIACVSYGDDGFEVKGKIKVDGYIKDRYSLDEYNGILRVVTTTESFIRKYYSFNDNESFSLDSNEGTSASLYCIDLASWRLAASVEKFAPKNETVRSVRFDKNYAYVCTAVQLTDPVFFFDLSDINNITYTETGNIEGFSTSLINLGNGYLLGIGTGNDWDTIKVEVYKESENSVVSVCSYEIENASYSLDYKSYYVDRKNQFFGFGYFDYGYSYSKSDSKYVLLHFSNGELIELVNTELKGDNTEKRAVYIDGYLYLISTEDFKVIGILNN